jgi:hypothetical protein
MNVDLEESDDSEEEQRRIQIDKKIFKPTQ